MGEGTPTVIASFGDLWNAVTGLFGNVQQALSTLTGYWFCFIPIVLLVGKRVISVGKSLLFYKSGRRRG